MSGYTSLGAAALVLTSTVAWVAVRESAHSSPVEQAALVDDATLEPARSMCRGEGREVDRSPRRDARDRRSRDEAHRDDEPADELTGIAIARVSILTSQHPEEDAAAALRATLADVELVDDELLAFLDYHLGIQASDIPSGIGVLDHATQVARVGARGVATEPDFYEGDFESLFPVAIDFAVSVDESDAAVAPAKHFSPATKRIFATFASETVVGENVLVKWTHVERNTVHIYGKYAVVPRAAHNYVWFDPHEAWPCGTYAVEIYSLTRNLEPIAGGRYVIRE